LAQLKFNVSEDLAKEFRQAVLAKRGKLAVSSEGEEALKLYLEKNRKDRKTDRTSHGSHQQPDSILQMIGIIKSKGRPNALEDLKRMEEETD
jgi:hypothetical protein